MDVVKGIINNDEGHGVKSMSGVLDRDNTSNSRDNVLRAVLESSNVLFARKNGLCDPHATKWRCFVW